MPLLAEFKQRARGLKTETFALYLAARHPGTPWYAKLLVAGIVAYAFSPIDLIPDFVPILGYLDDLILIPMGIALAVKMVPAPVLAECRARAQEVILNGKPVSRVGGAVIILIWVVLTVLCIMWAYKAFMPMPAAPNVTVEREAPKAALRLLAVGRLRVTLGPERVQNLVGNRHFWYCWRIVQLLGTQPLRHDVSKGRVDTLMERIGGVVGKDWNCQSTFQVQLALEECHVVK